MQKTLNGFRIKAVPGRKSSDRWHWVVFRQGKRAPARRSPPLFASEADAVEAGKQVAEDMHRLLRRPSVGLGI
jgi:hypothetical protein